jgi:hypothetical protein
MYSILNASIPVLLAHFKPGYVEGYDQLLADLPQAAQEKYRSAYASYWQFRGVCPAWCQAHFQILQAAAGGTAPDLEHVLHALYQVPSTARGDHRLHFAFATKLLHTLAPSLPIFDSRICAFFGFSFPPTAAPLAERIASCVAVHAFLQMEYQRIIDRHLLAPAIAAFRAHLHAPHWTDQKVIDSLIWAFMAALLGNGVLQGQIVYG